MTEKPENVTARRIIEAIQGPYSLAKCLKHPDDCEKSETCPVRNVLQKAEAKLLAVFEDFTISDMIRWKTEHIQQKAI